MKDFSCLRVGDRCPEMQIKRDGCVFLWGNGFPIINVLINKPTQQMLEMGDTQTYGLKLGAYSYGNVLTIAVKAGMLPWQDAPYNPFVDREDSLRIPDDCHEGMAIPLTYILSDSSTGEILKIHSFALSNSFSNYLLNEMRHLVADGEKKSFSFTEYVQTVYSIQRRYTSSDIGERVKQAYFRLKGEKG